MRWPWQPKHECPVVRYPIVFLVRHQTTFPPFTPLTAFGSEVDPEGRIKPGTVLRCRITWEEHQKAKEHFGASVYDLSDDADVRLLLHEHRTQTVNEVADQTAKLMESFR